MEGEVLKLEAAGSGRVLRAAWEGGPVETLTCEPGVEALAGRALGSAGPGSLGLAPRV